jgi:hypothetical protein
MEVKNMQKSNLLIFSTEIFTFQFNTEEIRPLINEILEKKEQIKKISCIYDNHGGIGNYYTDFKDPVKLVEYEKLMFLIATYFHNKNNSFFMSSYWSAIYNLGGLHNKHIHSNFVRGSQNNYSSVLYLTSLGATKFYNSNSTSTQDDAVINSEVGKLIFFPSNLLHSAENLTQGERIIISSNIRINLNDS